MLVARRLKSVAMTAALLITLFATAAVPASAAEGVATLASPSPGEQEEPTTVVAEDPMDAMLDFAACMRDHGVDMPDPSSEGGMVMVLEGVDSGDGLAAFDDTFVVAEEACRSHLGAMAPAGGDPELDAEIMEGLLAYSGCMRDHGIDMPDPVMSGNTIQIGAPIEGAGATGPDIDYFSEEYQAAEEACRDVGPFGDLGSFAAPAP